MKQTLCLVLLCLCANSSFASVVFSKTYECEFNQTATVKLNVETNFPARLTTIDACTYNEMGERVCDKAFSLKNAMTAYWDVKTTIIGLPEVQKTAPVDILIFPTASGNNVMITSGLSFKDKKFILAEDMYLSYWFGAEISLNTQAVLKQDASGDFILQTLDNLSISQLDFNVMAEIPTSSYVECQN